MLSTISQCSGCPFTVQIQTSIEPTLKILVEEASGEIKHALKYIAFLRNFYNTF